MMLGWSDFIPTMALSYSSALPLPARPPVTNRVLVADAMRQPNAVSIA